jgi:hypothetical protein
MKRSYETTGWQFEPVMSQEKKQERERERQEEEEFIEMRNCPPSEWCRCDRCTQLTNPLDNICCCDDEALTNKKLENEKSCITDHPGFLTTTLDKEVLNMVRNDLLVLLSKPKFKETFDHDKKKQLKSDSNKTFRFLAYRNFVSWINSGVKLGKNNRVRLPSCVVSKIRDKWPEPSGKYIGFCEAQFF